LPKRTASPTNTHTREKELREESIELREER
jgi:hypothetical protein